MGLSAVDLAVARVTSTHSVNHQLSKPYPVVSILGSMKNFGSHGVAFPLITLMCHHYEPDRQSIEDKTDIYPLW